MLKGFICAMISMALWGTSFVLPLFLAEFSSIEITAGRFFTYGVVSLCALAYYLYKGEKLPSLRSCALAAVMALTGFVGYYVCLVTGIKALGGPMATLLVGLLPVCVSMYGNWKNQEFPLTLFILPLIVIFSGLGVIHGRELTVHSGRDLVETALGLTALFAGIGAWTWYAVHNGRFLRANPQVAPAVWCSLIGVFCMVAAGLMLGTYAWLSTEPVKLASNLTLKAELLAFAVVSVGLGIGASYISTLMWSRASLILPMSLLGQLVVFEVLFGLIYVYIKEGTFPSQVESTGIALVLLGILWSFLRVNHAQKLARAAVILQQDPFPAE